MLWNEARKKENKQDNPNNELPPEDPRSEPQKPLGNDSQIGGLSRAMGTATERRYRRIVQQPVAGRGHKGDPPTGKLPLPGATGQIQPLEDKKNIQPLSPERRASTRAARPND